VVVLGCNCIFIFSDNRFRFQMSLSLLESSNMTINVGTRSFPEGSLVFVKLIGFPFPLFFSLLFFSCFFFWLFLFLFQKMVLDDDITYF